MATKKVKGQKIDLAALHASSAVNELPTAPSQDRPEGGRRGGFNRDGGRGGGRGGYDRRDEGDRWSRTGPRDRGGFGDRDRGFDRREGGYNRDGPRGYGGRDSAPIGERPKVNLAPRGASATMPPAPPVDSITTKIDNVTITSPPKDKWETVFAKGSGSDSYRSRGGDSYDRSRGGDSWGSRNEGRDRDFGFGDRSHWNTRDRRGGEDDRYGSFGTRRATGDARQLDRENEELLKDPRFANKFSSLRQDAPPTGPASSGYKSFNTAASIPTLPTAPTQEKTLSAAAEKAAEEKRLAAEEKAAKIAAMQAAEQRMREEAAAAIEKAKGDVETALKAAEACVASGKKGDELLAHIKTLSEKPTGAALVEASLTTVDPTNTVELGSWAKLSEYGAAMKALLEDNSLSQMLALYAVQKYVYKHNFPKLSMKSGDLPVIDVLFRYLYQFEIVDVNGFNKWFDDDNDDNIVGRNNALVQATTFMNWLNEEDEEEGDESEEEMDFDRPAV